MQHKINQSTRREGCVEDGLHVADGKHSVCVSYIPWNPWEQRNAEELPNVAGIEEKKYLQQKIYCSK